MTHGERRHVIKRVALLLFAVAMVSGVVAAQAQTTTPTDGKLPTKSAKEVRGATPYVEIENEPPPKLIVDPLRPEWRTCASHPCSGRVAFRYLHVSGICT